MVQGFFFVREFTWIWNLEARSEWWGKPSSFLLYPKQPNLIFLVKSKVGETAADYWIVQVFPQFLDKFKCKFKKQCKQVSGCNSESGIYITVALLWEMFYWVESVDQLKEKVWQWNIQPRAQTHSSSLSLQHASFTFINKTLFDSSAFSKSASGLVGMWQTEISFNQKR